MRSPCTASEIEVQHVFSLRFSFKSLSLRWVFERFPFLPEGWFFPQFSGFGHLHSPHGNAAACFFFRPQKPSFPDFFSPGREGISFFRSIHTPEHLVRVPSSCRKTIFIFCVSKPHPFKRVIWFFCARVFFPPIKKERVILFPRGILRVDFLGCHPRGDRAITLAVPPSSP